MLFNTLAYAKFFAIVFVVSWLLVRRSSVLWLPWVALLSYALFGAPIASAAGTPAEWGIVLASLLLTGTLAKKADTAADATPPQRLLLASLTVNITALAWLADHLADERAAGRRVLAGFDFPFGYPRGFAAALTGQLDNVTQLKQAKDSGATIIAYDRLLLNTENVDYYDRDTNFSPFTLKA